MGRCKTQREIFKLTLAALLYSLWCYYLLFAINFSSSRCTYAAVVVQTVKLKADSLPSLYKIQYNTFF